MSGDATRALAVVVVVATPCPLILAPIAFVAGISRAAGMGIIVKSGAAIETLGRVGSVLLDKTGTLTLGAPHVEEVLPVDGYSRLNAAGEVPPPRSRKARRGGPFDESG